MVFVVLSLSGFDYQRYHKNHARFPASFGEGIDFWLNVSILRED
jgi:hypothetical protein